MATVTRRDAIAVLGGATLWPGASQGQGATMQSWPLGTPRPTGIHDLAPAPDGGVGSPRSAAGTSAGSTRRARAAS